MRIPGFKSLRQSAKWIRSRFVNHALILGYHRVADTSRDPFGMCVGVKNFAEQMDIVSRYTNPISLDKLVEGLGQKDLPERALVITFDDGYADILYHALPLLVDRQIPTTVFVTTGNLGNPFWWDELVSIIFTRGSSLAEIYSYLNMGPLERIRGEIAQRNSFDEFETRRQLLMAIYQWLLHLPIEEREFEMSRLGKLYGRHVGDPVVPRKLTPEELMELGDSDLVDFGAHTVNHPYLTELSPEDQCIEIQECKSYLEGLLKEPVHGFSYPNGAYSEETLGIVRKGGFAYACASHGDIVHGESQKFALPRFWAQDCDGETFDNWLRYWLSD